MARRGRALHVKRRTAERRGVGPSGGKKRKTRRGGGNCARRGQSTRGGLRGTGTRGLFRKRSDLPCSRFLVKIGHYDAICVTDQRAWAEHTRTLYREENKGVEFLVERGRDSGERADFKAVAYKYL